MNSLSRIRTAALAVAVPSLVAVAALACGGSAEHSTAPAAPSAAAPASGSAGTASSAQRIAATRASTNAETTLSAGPESGRSATSSPQSQPAAPASAPAATTVLMAASSPAGPPGQPGPQGAMGAAGPAPQPAGPVIPPESGGTDNPNDGAYPLTYYQRYGVNPFIDADEDPLSTFALDGDTASYEILKQYLRDGYLVEPDAVRVEEYVNSLPQDYPAADPPTTDLGLHLDAGPAPFGDAGYKLLRVGVSNPAPADDRDPVSLVFVVDVSGSWTCPAPWRRIIAWAWTGRSSMASPSR